MIELHLIGYTADLGRLVLDLGTANGGRYRLVVDEDLFATIDELREQRREAGLPVGDLVEYAEELGLDHDHLARIEQDDARAAAAAGHVSTGSAAGARVLSGSLPADPDVTGPGADEPDEPPVDAAPDAAVEEIPDAAPDAAVEEIPDAAPDAAVEETPEEAPDETPDETIDAALEEAAAAAVEEAPSWDLDEGADHDDTVIDLEASVELTRGADTPPADQSQEPASPADEPTVSEPATGAPSASAREDDEAPAGGWRPAPLPTRDPPVWEDDRAVGPVASSSVRLVDRPPPDPGDAPAPATPHEQDTGASDDEGGLIARMLDERADRPPGPAPEDPEPTHTPSPPPSPPPGPVGEPPAAPRPLAVPNRRDAADRQPPRPLADDPPRRSRTPARTSPQRADRRGTPAARPEATPEAALTPAEIQARLRRGRSVRTVAREAGVNEDWIRRWEAPILTERARVRDRALAARLQRSRLGTSSLPLGESVRHNLAAKGVDEDDLAWDVSRRRDGRWRIAVRYSSRGRRRSATWLWDPQEATLAPASDGARDLGFTRRDR